VRRLRSYSRPSFVSRPTDLKTEKHPTQGANWPPGASTIRSQEPLARRAAFSRSSDALEEHVAAGSRAHLGNAG
jgi:hypothetical protein